MKVNLILSFFLLLSSAISLLFITPFAIASSPNVPYPVEPDGDTITNGKVTLEWAYTSGATSWGWQIEYSSGGLYKYGTSTSTTQKVYDLADGSYRWRVSACNSSMDCSEWSSSTYGYRYFSVDNNICPSITVNNPPTNTIVTQGDLVYIRWTGSDEDVGDDITVSVMYDEDQTWDNGNEHSISPSQPKSASLNWNTSTVSPGTYYIVCRIYDGTCYDFDYASGSVTVQAPNTCPNINVTSPASDLTVTQGQYFTVSWNGTDPDDAATVDIGYDTDNNYANGGYEYKIFDRTEDGSYSFSTEEVPPGTYYIIALIKDGRCNDHDYSEGRVIVQAPIPAYGNGLWLDHAWVTGNQLHPELMQNLADILYSHQIYNVYINVGMLSNNGAYIINEPTLGYSTFLSEIRAKAPAVKIYAWLNASTYVERDCNQDELLQLRMSGTTNTNFETIENIRDTIIGRLGSFDGVHLDIEPIYSSYGGDLCPNGSFKHLIALLDELSTSLPMELSIATNGYAENHNYEWGASDFQAVFNLVDHAATMTYGVPRGLEDIPFSTYIQDAVTAILNAADSTNIEKVTIGLSVENGYDCSDPPKLNYNIFIEEFRTGLRTITSSSSKFDGVSIYMDCLMNQNLWVNCWDAIWLNDTFGSDCIFSLFNPWPPSSPNINLLLVPQPQFN